MNSSLSYNVQADGSYVVTQFYFRLGTRTLLEGKAETQAQGVIICESAITAVTANGTWEIESERKQRA